MGKVIFGAHIKLKENVSFQEQQEKKTFPTEMLVLVVYFSFVKWNAIKEMSLYQWKIKISIFPALKQTWFSIIFFLNCYVKEMASLLAA